MSFKKYNEGFLNYICEFYECNCHSSEHLIKVSYMLDDTGEHLEEEDPEVYIEVHLSNYKNFFQRIWGAVKYVFGHQSRYGDFDCFTFKDQDVDNLLDVLNNYKKLRAEKK